MGKQRKLVEAPMVDAMEGRPRAMKERTRRTYHPHDYRLFILHDLLVGRRATNRHSSLSDIPTIYNIP